ncbi:hypothetical protein [Janthinobacterium sp. AD80]|uniref:hypothetical protein n=1 Tax=Janthinobacterium sp. AD80 TaxID=1528773 RepID=UPI000CBA041B|nr:hypothetical protein [Janthinobacterium sp. AD80]PMQ16511.1 hypothetical protein JaAD80_10575 [Janthinobacterium sp. AD80]
MSTQTTKYSYFDNTPAWMMFVLAPMALLALVPLLNFSFLAWQNLDFKFFNIDVLSLGGLGQMGDFFGGHMAAFAGSLSLLVVIFFTFHQANQQRQFFDQQQYQQRQFFDQQQSQTNQASMRTFFLEGVNQITQWDIESPGCDQCMRLLDYYGRVALASEDRELLLILNTVITAKIRKNLQGENGSFKQSNYPYACKALDHIKPLREEDGRALAAQRGKKRPKA